MVARRTSSAGFVAGARPDGVSGAIRRVDFYAKLPSELAEGSIIGGLVSIIATAAFVALFLAQFRALHQVGTRTDIVVDHEPDKSFQIIQIYYQLSLIHPMKVCLSKILKI